MSVPAQDENETEVGHPVPVAGPDRGNGDVRDIVDEWGYQSFPASDSPQNW